VQFAAAAIEHDGSATTALILRELLLLLQQLLPARHLGALAEYLLGLALWQVHCDCHTSLQLSSRKAQNNGRNSKSSKPVPDFPCRLALGTRFSQEARPAPHGCRFAAEQTNLDRDRSTWPRRRRNRYVTHIYPIAWFAPESDAHERFCQSRHEFSLAISSPRAVLCQQSMPSRSCHPPHQSRYDYRRSFLGRILHFVLAIVHLFAEIDASSPYFLFPRALFAIWQRTSTGDSPFSKYPSYPVSQAEKNEPKKKFEQDKRVIVGPLRVGKSPQAAQWTKSVTLMNMKAPKSMLSRSASMTMVVPPFC
jgi:hypothetical protein